MVLARSGYSGQQTDEPLRADRPDDLYEPVSGDHGAHGEFDARSKSFSAAWWVSKHRAALLGGALAAIAGSALVTAALGSSRWT
jgi:carbohydrate-selective porin OprB